MFFLEIFEKIENFIKISNVTVIRKSESHLVKCSDLSTGLSRVVKPFARKSPSEVQNRAESISPDAPDRRKRILHAPSDVQTRQEYRNIATDRFGVDFEGFTSVFLAFCLKIGSD